MTKRKMFYLRIDLHKETWELEIYRNVPFMFHLDCNNSWDYRTFEFVFLGILIEFYQGLLEYEAAYPIVFWWEKLVALCAGATVYGDHALFKEFEHYNHLRWLFKNRAFIPTGSGTADERKTAQDEATYEHLS